MPTWILDAVLGVFLIAMLVIGFKRGFIRTVLKLAAPIGGIIIAFLFVEPLADLLVEHGLFSSIGDKLINNIKATEAYQQYVIDGGTFNVQLLIDKLGIPEFLESFFTDAFTSSTGSINVDEAITSIANSVVGVIAIVVSFIGLLIIASLGFWGAKLLIGKLRDKVKIIKIVDGIFGVIIFTLIAFLVIYTFLLISSLIMQSNTNGFTEFMNAQLHLSDDKFGLAKWFYENNYLGNFISLFL